MRIPRNQIEFEKMFTTEEQCLDYLKELRFPDGYSCRKCKHNDYWYNKRRIMVCKRKSNSRGLLFQKLIEQGVLYKPIEYKEIKRM